MGKPSFSFASMARTWKAKQENAPKAGECDEIDKCSKKLAAEEQELALARATIPIETRICSGERLWDQDFSSMSSYASHDLDNFMNSCACTSKLHDSVESGSEYEIQPISEASSSRIEASSGDFGVEIVETDEDEEEQIRLMRKREERAKQRRLRNRESLSAALPTDLMGPAKQSIPLVKESYDPYRDFRDSITEMVSENGIVEWQELQELLYCFISLNSAEHHESIRCAFIDVLIDLRRQSDDLEQDCVFDWP